MRQQDATEKVKKLTDSVANVEIRKDTLRTLVPLHDTKTIPPLWRWYVEEEISAIERWGAQWNALAIRYGSAPTADALWTDCFWQAFCRGKERLVLHILTYQNQLVAMFPLRRQGQIISGWASTVNAHTPYWTAAVAEDLPGVIDYMLSHLLDSSDYVDFYPLPKEGYLFNALTNAARLQGLLVAVTEEGVPGDIVIDVSRSWSAFRATLSRNLVKNTERQYRRLQETGQVSFDVITDRDVLSQVLAECFAVEAHGWKGQRGTAMSSQQDTLKFYTDLAYGAAARGSLAIYTLRVGPKLVAFDLCLTTHDRIDSLKASFDPDFASYSPGNVLLYLELQRESNLGRVHTFHLGPPAEWKLRWNSRLEPSCRLRIYSSSIKGQIAYLAGPKLRSLLVTPRTRPLISKLRSIVR